MSSIAVFLILAFLTGFQAAVLSDEPPKSILEQAQDQIENVPTVLGEYINVGLDKIKDLFTSEGLQRAWDLAAEVPKKLSNKNTWLQNRKLQQFAKTAKQKLQEGVSQLQNHGVPWATEQLSLVKQQLQEVTEKVNNKVQELYTQVEQIAGDLKDQIQEAAKPLTQMGEEFLNQQSPSIIQPTKDLLKKLVS
ncbi:uncharacterized protein PHA67_002894 [Liasis olivaceus]